MNGNRVTSATTNPNAVVSRASAMPAEIDIDVEGISIRGIYELDGDTLTLCWVGSIFERGPRPDRFESTEDYPTTLFVFRRVEEDDE